MMMERVRAYGTNLDCNAGELCLVPIAATGKVQLNCTAADLANRAESKQMRARLIIVVLMATITNHKTASVWTTASRPEPVACCPWKHNLKQKRILL